MVDAEQRITQDVEAYVKELYTNSVISTSHITLRDLYRKYNHDEVDARVRKQITLVGYAARA